MYTILYPSCTELTSFRVRPPGTLAVSSLHLLPPTDRTERSDDQGADGAADHLLNVRTDDRHLLAGRGDQVETGVVRPSGSGFGWFFFGPGGFQAEVAC